MIIKEMFTKKEILIVSDVLAMNALDKKLAWRRVRMSVISVPMNTEASIIRKCYRVLAGLAILITAMKVYQCLARGTVAIAVKLDSFL